MLQSLHSHITCLSFHRPLYAYYAFELFLSICFMSSLESNPAFLFSFFKLFWSRLMLRIPGFCLMLHAPIVLRHRSTVFYNVKTFILITWVSWVSSHKISKRKYQEVKVCTICKKIKRTAGIAYLNRVRHVRGVIDAIEEIFAQLNVQHTTDVYTVIQDCIELQSP